MQPRQDLNLQPPSSKDGALPFELRITKATLVGRLGLEPRPAWLRARCATLTPATEYENPLMKKHGILAVGISKVSTLAILIQSSNLVENKGFEPLTPVCKTGVFPISTNSPKNLQTVKPCPQGDRQTDSLPRADLMVAAILSRLPSLSPSLR